jgi:hypothetical protein
MKTDLVGVLASGFAVSDTSLMANSLIGTGPKMRAADDEEKAGGTKKPRS